MEGLVTMSEHYPSTAPELLEFLAAKATKAGIIDESETLLRHAAFSSHNAKGNPAIPEETLATEESRVDAGYGHTLREITQQPLTWADTALRASAFAADVFRSQLEQGAFRSIAITGSGSSHYVAELAAPAIEAELGIPVRAIPSGDILAYGEGVLPKPGPVLLISLARSGNSPESVAAVRVVMKEQPDSRFLNVTCNAKGQLATEYPEDPRVQNLLLHPATHDHSLVMTSSFSSMALALIALACARNPDGFRQQAAQLCTVAREMMPSAATTLSRLPYERFQRALFLGGGCQFGASREAALKLTEMTAGRIVSMPETFLGLRHGPMAAVSADTLVVAMLPPDERPRRYALDLLQELRLKELGKVTVIPEELFGISVSDEKAPPITQALPEAFQALLGVLTGQWTGFFACLHHGLRPDAPAETGVITRVVPPFPLYH